MSSHNNRRQTNAERLVEALFATPAPVLSAMSIFFLGVACFWPVPDEGMPRSFEEQLNAGIHLLFFGLGAAFAIFGLCRLIWEIATDRYQGPD